MSRKTKKVKRAKAAEHIPRRSGSKGPRKNHQDLTKVKLIRGWR